MSREEVEPDLELRVLRTTLGAIFRTGMELAYGIAFPVTSTCDVLIAEEAAATGPCSAQGAVGAVCASRGHAASNETWHVT